MNKLSSEDNDKLKKAIELQKKDFDKESLSILLDLVNRNSENAKVLGFTGLILSKMEKREESITYIEKALNLNPNNELLCLSLYNSYAHFEKYEKAFKILFTYLENYSANLFKDTLEELLEGLLEGYGNTYQDKIIFYAKKSGVNIPKELDNHSN